MDQERNTDDTEYEPFAFDSQCEAPLRLHSDGNLYSSEESTLTSQSKSSNNSSGDVSFVWRPVSQERQPSVECSSVDQVEEKKEIQDHIESANSQFNSQASFHFIMPSKTDNQQSSRKKVKVTETDAQDNKRDIVHEKERCNTWTKVRRSNLKDTGFKRPLEIIDLERSQPTEDQPKKIEKKQDPSDHEEYSHSLWSESNDGVDKQDQEPDTSEMFYGLTFIITGLKKETKRKKKHGQDGVTHKNIEQLITGHGGAVKENFELALGRDLLIRSTHGTFPGLIVVSNKAHRTFKYFCAIALSLSAIHFNWIKHSVEQRILLPLKAYLLPYGESVIGSSDMVISPLDERQVRFILIHNNELMGCVILSKVRCLQGVRIGLGGTTEFLKQWETICRYGGASVIHVGTVVDASKEGINFIVSDPYPSQEFLLKCKKIPIVGCEYLIQCLINKKILDPASHPHFHYSYRRT